MLLAMLVLALLVLLAVLLVAVLLLLLLLLTPDALRPRRRRDDQRAGGQIQENTSADHAALPARKRGEPYPLSALAAVPDGGQPRAAALLQGEGAHSSSSCGALY